MSSQASGVQRREQQHGPRMGPPARAAAAKLADRATASSKTGEITPVDRGQASAHRAHGRRLHLTRKRATAQPTGDQTRIREYCHEATSSVIAPSATPSNTMALAALGEIPIRPWGPG